MDKDCRGQCQRAIRNPLVTFNTSVLARLMTVACIFASSNGDETMNHRASMIFLLLPSYGRYKLEGS